MERKEILRFARRLRQTGGLRAIGKILTEVYDE